MTEKNYTQELMGYLTDNENFKTEIPGPGKSFDLLHWAVSQPGACSPKAKELMALAIAITMRCEGCMVQHTAGCIMAGASRDEVKEAISVALEMSGGPSFVFGAKVIEIFDQLSVSADFHALMAKVKGEAAD